MSPWSIKRFDISGGSLLEIFETSSIINDRVRINRFTDMDLRFSEIVFTASLKCVIHFVLLCFSIQNGFDWKAETQFAQINIKPAHIQH